MRLQRRDFVLPLRRAFMLLQRRVLCLLVVLRRNSLVKLIRLGQTKANEANLDLEGDLIGEANLAGNTEFTGEAEPKLVRPIWQVGG